jgi:hypothetical protein
VPPLPKFFKHMKRFLCSREGKFSLSDNGFLSDPDSDYGKYLNPEITSFDNLTDCRCLVILGEPGMGKSTEIERMVEVEDARVGREGEVLYFRLRDYETDFFLHQEIFENASMKRFETGTHTLYLFLDDLDEALVSVKTLANLLSSRFKNLPTERLYLRIACRTAEWPSVLEKALNDLWKEEEVKILELVPLRKGDVREFVELAGYSPDAFIEEIREKEAVSLAIKPLTLKFLVRLFGEHQALPKTQIELYTEGCRLLCSDVNDSRIDSGRTSPFSSEQLLAVAERIAAVTLFSNMAAIWKAPDQGDVPVSDITVSKLCGGNETAGQEAFHVTEAHIRETLKTGLFNSRGANRIGWAHKTYTEFLAARYLLQRGMTIAQKMSLFTHPGNEENRLIPQLNETAGWLAGMDREVFRAILSHDPQVLLFSDVPSAEPEDQAALVKSLLDLFDQEKLLDDDWDLRSKYKKLNHPTLVDQLRPYISDATKGFLVRQVAIDVAEDCGLTSLQAELANVSLDITQPITVRVNAAYALNKVGDKETKAKLKPLAYGEAGEDPDDQLKGCGLKAIWPDLIPAEEMFSLLTYPRRSNFTGSYKTFLYECAKHLQASDLLTALQWIETAEIDPDGRDARSEVRDDIIELAWRHLDQPEVLSLLVRIILSNLRQFDKSTQKAFDQSASNRHQVLEAILPNLPSLNQVLYRLTSGKVPLVRGEDLPHLIKLLKREKQEDIKVALSELVLRVFNIQNSSQTELIIDESLTEPVLADRFRDYLQPIQLESQQAETLRARFREWNEGQENSVQQLEPTEHEQRAIELIDEALRRCEAGDQEQWAWLNRLLTIAIGSEYWGDEIEADLRALPRWQTLDAETRRRIVSLAYRYVMEGDPKTAEWFGTNTTYYSALAGYRALFLLHEEEPQHLFSLTGDIWGKWVPIILLYTVPSEVDKQESHYQLVRRCYEQSKNVIHEYLLKVVDLENADGSLHRILSKFKYCWDDDLRSLLETKLQDQTLKPACFRQILEELLEEESEIAKEYAQSILATNEANELEGRVLVAAGALFTHAKDCGWNTLWPLIEMHTELGHSLFETFAYNPHKPYGEIFARLKEQQLAQLYSWLAQQFSHKDDPGFKDFGVVTYDDSVRRFRDSVLEFLREKGSKEAVYAIQLIAATLPELDWINFVVLRAQARMRQVTWEPQAPETILALAANSQKRLVQTGTQLLDVVIDSLDRLSQKLHGETPAVADLWNQFNRDTFTPKDENHLSDYVKRHLDDDLRQRGIVINREVEIRRAPGAPIGERTDIRVEAIAPTDRTNEFDKVSVIIETKGCWNAELNEAMQTQLKERYLKEGFCSHGLYLVGWFTCDKWDPDDRRNRRSQRIVLNNLSEQLRNQANTLSQHGTLIKSYILDATL